MHLWADVIQALQLLSRRHHLYTKYISLTIAALYLSILTSRNNPVHGALMAYGLVRIFIRVLRIESDTLSWGYRKNAVGN